jgi:hypothetical protein
MHRSLELIDGKKIPAFDVAALKWDFEKVVADEGWGVGLTL